MINNNKGKPSGGIIFAGILVLALTISGQLLGFVREIVYAKYFGTEALFDSFTLSINFILFLGGIFAGIPFLIIPMMSEYIAYNDNERVNSSISTLIILTACAGITIVFLLQIFSNHIIYLLAPGFDNIRYDFALRIFRISAPVLLVLFFSSLFKSILNLKYQFIVPGLESLIFNIGIIISIIAGWHLLGILSPLSIPFGFYLAYGIFLSVCLFFIRKQYSFNLYWDKNFIKTISSGLLYVLSITFINNLSPVVLMWHGSFLPEGDISGLGYVARIMNFAVGGVINSFLVVYLPSISIGFYKDGIEILRSETEKLLVLFLSFSMSAAVFLYLNNVELVTFFFKGGVFDNESVFLVSNLILCYIPWILTYPIANIGSRVLYIKRDYRVLLLITGISLIFTVCAAPFAARLWGIYGLAITSSAHMALYCLLMTIIIYRGGIYMISTGAILHCARFATVLIATAIMFMFTRRFELLNSMDIFIYSFILISCTLAYNLYKNFPEIFNFLASRIKRVLIR